MGVQISDKVAYWDANTHKWHKGVIHKVSKQKCSIYVDDAKTLDVKPQFIFRYKNGGKKKHYKHTYSEVIPTKKVRNATTRRLPRVIALHFNGSNKYGDMGYMLGSPHLYWKHDSVMIFNDNVDQFLSKCTFAGGGNACIRPYRQSGQAHGIPTGDCGGFRSLQDTLIVPQRYLPTDSKYMTAKEVIDQAITELVDHLVKDPSKKYLYYSADANNVLGCGIFNVAEEVKQYITQEIHSVPKRVYSCMMNRNT